MLHRDRGWRRERGSIGKARWRVLRGGVPIVRVRAIAKRDDR